MQLQLFPEISIGLKERLPCRLLAIRVSDDEARLRRCKLISEAKDKGAPVSERVLKMASWRVLGCNISRDMLSFCEAFVLERTRWQIELIFKLWKSYGCIDERRTQNPWRIICEVYGKLVAMIIQHWILLAGCWEYPDRSLFKAVKTIRKGSVKAFV